MQRKISIMVLAIIILVMISLTGCNKDVLSQANNKEAQIVDSREIDRLLD